MSQKLIYLITITKKENLFKIEMFAKRREKKKKKGECGLWCTNWNGRLEAGGWWCWPPWSFWLEQDYLFINLLLMELCFWAVKKGEEEHSSHFFTGGRKV